MSDKTILVTVPFSCSRQPEKNLSVQLPIQEAEDFVASQQAKKDNASTIVDMLSNLEHAPDLALLYKGRIVVFANVHASSDAAIGRAVNDIAKQEICDVPKRKRRAKATPTEETPEETPEVELDFEDEA